MHAFYVFSFISMYVYDLLFAVMHRYYFSNTTTNNSIEILYIILIKDQYFVLISKYIGCLKNENKHVLFFT